MPKFSDYFLRMQAITSGLPGGSPIEHFHSGAWQPPVDIFERPDRIVLVVELPGVDKEDLDVYVERDILKITGVRPKRIPEGTQHVHQMEIAYGHFARFVKLPACADVDHIEAQFKDGYLTIEIPRAS